MLVRELRPGPALGIGEDERGKSEELNFRAASCERGDEHRGGVGVDELEESDSALPPLMSDTEASSLAPSVMAGADFIHGGDRLGEGSNCDTISIPRAVRDVGIIPGYLQSSTCLKVHDRIVTTATASQTQELPALTTGYQPACPWQP